jgi:hypothetical protein
MKKLVKKNLIIIYNKVYNEIVFLKIEKIEYEKELLSIIIDFKYDYKKFKLKKFSWFGLLFIFRYN